jgi:hypothetical protein
LVEFAHSLEHGQWIWFPVPIRSSRRDGRHTSTVNKPGMGERVS